MASGYSFEILDACCGGRMWWWDKDHPLAMYLDEREVPKGDMVEQPGWSVEPTVLGDYRDLPWPDGTFQQVVFDPPHVIRPNSDKPSFTTRKYGQLDPEDWEDELRRGLAECWRVLAPGGTLVFKWHGWIHRISHLFPVTPTVGTRDFTKSTTAWTIFYKPLVRNAS